MKWNPIRGKSSLPKSLFLMWAGTYQYGWSGGWGSVPITPITCLRLKSFRPGGWGASRPMLQYAPKSYKTGGGGGVNNKTNIMHWRASDQGFYPVTGCLRNWLNAKLFSSPKALNSQRLSNHELKCRQCFFSERINMLIAQNLKPNRLRAYRT